MKVLECLRIDPGRYLEGCEMEKCENCRFWSKNDGDCRRYPPVLAPRKEQEIIESSYGVFPGTSGDDWCGEYEKVPE